MKNDLEIIENLILAAEQEQHLRMEIYAGIALTHLKNLISEIKHLRKYSASQSEALEMMERGAL